MPTRHITMFGLISIFNVFKTWDSILSNAVTQMVVHLQALVRIFCGQFFYAFNKFDTSLSGLLRMFGVSGFDMSDLNWMEFRPDGTVLNAFAAFAMIGVFLAVLILVISLFRIALAPIVEAREKPLTVVVRFVIALILIFYSPSIISLISDASETINTQMKTLATSYGNGVEDRETLFKDVTHYDEIADAVGESIKEGTELSGAPEGAPDPNMLQSAGEALVEIVCTIVLMVEFLKLISEICMREMVLLMLYLFFPTMSGTVVSRETETIFKRYFQSLIVQILLVSTSMIWYWMFINLCSTMDFKTFGIVVGMLMEIGFVQMVKSVDNHLAQLGVSSAAVSGNLFDSIMGTIHTTSCSLSQMGRLGGSLAKIAPVGKNLMNRAQGLGGNVPTKSGMPDKTKMVSVPADKLLGATAGSAAGEAVRSAMNNSDIFNGQMNSAQRNACVRNMFGEKNLAQMAAQSGITSLPTEWMRNPDGSFTGYGAEFASGNKGNITLSSANKVAPGAAMDEKFNMANGRPNEQFVMGAGGKINARDVSLEHMPKTEGEALSQTGHSLQELRQSPGMASGYMNSTEAFMQNSVLGSREDKNSIRSDMANDGIHIKDGSMSSGRDGLVHGKANIGAAGEQNVVMGSESELRNAGYSNLASFHDAGGNQIAMALAKDAQSGSIGSVEHLTDAQAQILGGESAMQFKDNAINHASLYADNEERSSHVADSLERSSISGEAFQKAREQNGLEVDVDAHGNMTGHVPGGASYDFVRDGQVDLGTEEGAGHAADYVAQDPEHNFADSAGNLYHAKANLDGEAHGAAGTSYDFPEFSGENVQSIENIDGETNSAVGAPHDFPEYSKDDRSGIDSDSFQYNVGSTASEIQDAFGDNRDIAGITIENNGAQTAYNADNEIQGVRMANRATSTKGNPDYQYDSVYATGITDSAEAAERFGEAATTMDGGRTWDTQSGTRYERMSYASPLFYGRDNGKTKMVTGQDDAGRPYTYVSTDKPKGFSSNPRPQDGRRKDKRRRRRADKES